MPGKKIPQDPKTTAKEGANNHLGVGPGFGTKPIPDVSPRPEAKDPIDINLCEPDYRVSRPQEISAKDQLMDYVRMNVNGQNEDFTSARQSTQEMRAYRRGE